MDATTSVEGELVLFDDAAGRAERVAGAGFLAGYAGSTRASYATDLRLFGTWCHEHDLVLLGVQRAHLEHGRGIP